MLLALSAGCAAKDADSQEHFNREFSSLVRPYTFDFPGWEFKTLSHQLSQAGRYYKDISPSDTFTVVKYFSGNRSQADPALKEQVKKILELQISQVLVDQGIDGSLLEWHYIFPGVNFVLESPPNILVVSPRDKIARIRDVTLKQDMNANDMEKLESEIRKLDVSALVIPIGGMGASYPSFVADTSNLADTIATATEEWLHQYLAFRPLGFRYVLDLLRIKPDPDIGSVNETVAGLASEEIGQLVLEKYYPQYLRGPAGRPSSGGFDYNAAMRKPRLQVDALLASGRIEQAESYMEQRRQLINSHGYHIRKINQAYFAFYGSYTYTATSIDPLGNQVRTLRSQSPSLKDFLKTASGLTSRQEIIDILNKRK
jgi:hypothetical protein